MAEGTCEECDAMFIPRQTTQRFCSARCNKRSRDRRAAERGYQRPLQTKVCVGCGKKFQTRRYRVCCSPGCKLPEAKAKRRDLAEMRRYIEFRLRSFEAQQTPCAECGSPLVKLGTKFCSAACSQAAVAKYQRQRHRDSYEPKVRAVQISVCAECGATFEWTRGGRGNRRTYCGTRCRDRATKRDTRHRRRERQAGTQPQQLSSLRMADLRLRERGRCGLCGKKINPSLRWPHPRSETLDHILPLAAGGKHEPANWQLAHAQCNIAKGDGGSDQLRLIG